jgi:hypothetical protein
MFSRQIIFLCFLHANPADSFVAAISLPLVGVNVFRGDAEGITNGLRT